MKTSLAVAIAGVLFLAACGDDGGASSSTDGELAVETIAAAPERVADAGSYRVEGSVEFVDAPSPFSVQFDGEFDTETGAASIQNTFSGPELDGTGFEMRVVDGVLYMDIEGLFAGLGELADELPSGATWVEIAAPELAGDLGATPGSDPTASLESLRGVSDDVTEVGTEEIRGIETTHYRTEIDPDRALDIARDQLEDLPEGQREAVENGLESLGGEPLLVDVWIDDDGLVRRQEMTFDAVIAGDSIQTVTTMEFFDYGADVDIQAPPPDETATFEEIFGVAPDDLEQLGSVPA